jgi:hypothetical protein
MVPHDLGRLNKLKSRIPRAVILLLNSALLETGAWRMLSSEEPSCSAPPNFGQVTQKYE